MRTIDRVTVGAPIDRVFRTAVDIERWPTILPHYRWVRVLKRTDGGDAGRGEGEGRLVEMAAWRPFGPLRFPTWWVSEMTVDHQFHTIRYRHVWGITRGMDVTWRLVPAPEGGVDVTIVHEWDGPAWPLVGRLAAKRVIGPVFIHAIARRTLAGIKRNAERAA